MSMNLNRNTPYKIITTLIILIALIPCTLKGQKHPVELLGKKQFVLLDGLGDPAVVFVTGLGQPQSDFELVYNDIKKTNRIFSYDRAGLGQSEALDNVRTVDTMACELNSLLTHQNIAPPFILVGHSMGGFIIRCFAAMYPEKVAGLIFVDASYEDEFIKGYAVRTEYDRIQFSNDFKSYANALDAPKSYNDEAKYYFDFDSTGYSTNGRIMRDLKIPTNIRITAIVSTKVDLENPYSKQEIESCVSFYQNMKNKNLDTEVIRTSKSGHFIQIEQPELVIDAIRKMSKKIKRY